MKAADIVKVDGKATMVWLNDFGYVELDRIDKIDPDKIYAYGETIPVSPSVADRVEGLYRESKAREVLANIIKVADAPPDTVNLMPEASLAYVADEAKKLLKLLSE
jgi:hypothetical protein